MNIKRRWIMISFASVTLLLMLARGATVQAADYQCTGSLGAIHVDNLIVPQNASCTLNGTVVNGNVTIRTNATLNAYDLQVNNDVKADGATSVSIHAGSSVGGNLQIAHSGAADIQSVDIRHNMVFNENDKSLNAANNTIGGTLQATKNTGGVSINSNTIDDNLQCKENVPPPVGSGNIVGGNMEDQCANFGGIPAPVPTVTRQSPTNTPQVATKTPVIDNEAPTVRWILPVLAGELYELREGEQILLEAGAWDNESIKEVRFFWWDAVNLRHITLATLVQGPFRININASMLNPEWNQVFVIASDAAGNKSDYPFIWLYKLGEGKTSRWIYLSIIEK